MATFFIKMDVSDLTEQDLRRLFDIMKKSHPDALASGLATLLQSDEYQNDGDGDGSARQASQYRLFDSSAEGDGAPDPPAQPSLNGAPRARLGATKVSPKTGKMKVEKTTPNESSNDDSLDTPHAVSKENGHFDITSKPSSKANDVLTLDDKNMTEKSEKISLDEVKNDVALDEDEKESPLEEETEEEDPITSSEAVSSLSEIRAEVEEKKVDAEEKKAEVKEKKAEAKAEATRQSPTVSVPNTQGTKGCYLYYDPSSAKLMLQYSNQQVPNAIGFYSSPTISEFKYKKNFGRAELIGNCASGVSGRKNYYSGWCQFVRAARSAFKIEEKSGASESDQGVFLMYPRQQDQQGLDVDIYLYNGQAPCHTGLIPTNKPLHYEIIDTDAVACLPKYTEFFADVKQVELNRWLTEANNSSGATSRFADGISDGNEAKNRESSQSLLLFSNSQNYLDLTTQPLDIQSPVRTLVDMTPSTPPQTNEYISSAESPALTEEVKIPSSTVERVGCYLLYEASSSKLMLNYSRTEVPNAIGFYAAGPGHAIQGFKFKRNFGRAELIGNCASGVAGRKNYYSGLCQFIRAARSVNGPVWFYPRAEGRQGLDVDIYVYYKNPEEQTDMNLDGQQFVKLDYYVPCNVSNIDAVACLPKFTDFFDEVKVVDLNKWLVVANAIGATSRFS